MPAIEMNRPGRRGMAKTSSRAATRGFSMIEVLVTIIIVTIGLLGLAGLQAYSIQAQFESYQRAQALILLNDMVDRINANRVLAATGAVGCYPITTNATNGTPYVGTVGAGSLSFPWTCAGQAGTQAGDRAAADITDWKDALLGAGEQKGGANVGVMIGARGCVSFDAATGDYTVAVAWQGNGPTFVSTNPCGKGLYGTDDRLRRVVSTTFRIANLAA